MLDFNGNLYTQQAFLIVLRLIVLLETFKSEYKDEDEYKISSAGALFPANSLLRGQLLHEISSSRQ